MKIKVPQDDLICNLRYVKICDYVFSYTNWIDNGKKCVIVNNNINILYNNILNDNRPVITIYYKLDHINTLNNLFKLCNNINKKIIIISGCSDYTMNKLIFSKRPSNIIKWYGENVDSDIDNLISLPMGSLSATWIGNNKLHAELYNHIDFKQILVDHKEPEIINLAFMCFSIGTNSVHRGNIYNYYKDKSYITNLCKEKTGNYLKDDEFIKNVYNHYFVICPFGNGIDCGRTWMALQLGSIPIMQYHICFKDWADNLPIILYNDIQEITEEFLLKKREEFKNKNFNYDYLKTSYWKSVWDKDKYEISQLT